MARSGRFTVFKGHVSDGTVVIAKEVSHKNKGHWYQVLEGSKQLLQVGPWFDAKYWTDAGTFVAGLTRDYCAGKISHEQTKQQKSEWLKTRTTDDHTCIVKNPRADTEAAPTSQIATDSRKRSKSVAAQGGQGIQITQEVAADWVWRR